MDKGVDLACFDWGVNSGAARGRKAYADTSGIVSPPARVKKIMAMRRSFYAAIIARNGKLAAFRKGWANRAAGIEAVAYKWALAAQGMKPGTITVQMQAEAATAQQTAAKKVGQAKAAGSGAVVAGPAVPAAAGWDWSMIAFGGVVIVTMGVIAFFAICAAQAERARSLAFNAEASNG
jgi:lysozyme family protein